MRWARPALLLALLWAGTMLHASQVKADPETGQKHLTRQEVRSLWALPWDISSPSKVAKLVETAINSHQNELLVEVRYRSDALYDTSRGAANFHNPEPRSHVLEIADYDPLLDVLELAHAAGIKVHAWIIVFNATPMDKTLLNRNYIMNNHPDWITRDKQHRIMNNGSQYGYYIDPGIPEAQDYLLEVIGNLVSGYPELDGIQLDYIRYPDGNWGYHPQSVARFQEYSTSTEETSFNEWRIMQVSSFVSRFQDLVKGINPQIVTSAAVFADIGDAYTQYAQDWTSWLRKGYIDRVYPMAYNTNLKNFSNHLKQYQLLGRNEDIIVGIRAWRDDGKGLLGTSGYTIADVAQRIEQVRANSFGGMALFSYSGIRPDAAWELLKDMSYPEQAAEFAIPQVQPKDKGVSFKPNACAGGFTLELHLPQTGLWSWTISGTEPLYEREGVYQEGENLLYWDGMIPADEDSDAFPLPYGNYTVLLRMMGSDYQYTIPVSFGETDTP